MNYLTITPAAIKLSEYSYRLTAGIVRQFQKNAKNNVWNCGSITSDMVELSDNCSYNIYILSRYIEKLSDNSWELYQ